MNRPSRQEGTIRCFHDGECPLCRLEIRAMRRLDTQQNIDWIDLHSGHPEMAQAGVDKSSAMAALHVVDANGTLLKGVPAFLLLWEQLPYYRRAAALIRSADLRRCSHSGVR